MILLNASLFGETKLRHIQVRDGIIADIFDEEDIPKNPFTLDLEGAIVLPGLINSHDHLDFNCYPQLGDKIYNNYTEWGPDIQSRYAGTIEQVKKIPVGLRIKWGLYKNLLNGFTTVVNHGEKLTVDEELVSVFQDTVPLHSPAFEKKWIAKLNNPFNRKIVAMHIGEGTDDTAREEIDRVIRFNITRRKIVAIHGVAMTEQQARSFAGLVWCPASNYFFLGKTAETDRLKKATHIVFGTDSTLTAYWNIREHFNKISGSWITETELLNMLTMTPANLWGLHDRGSIKPGNRADILVLKPGTSLMKLDPSSILMVIHKGETKLMDETLASSTLPGSHSRIILGNTIKMVKGDLPSLTSDIQQYFPELEIPFETDYG